METVIIGVFLLVLVLLFEWPRKVFSALVGAAAPAAWKAAAGLMHAIGDAHLCVLSNLRPREVVLAMKERRPTSAANDDI